MTPQFFELSINVATADGYDEDCLPQTTTPNFRSDFLTIPGAITDNGAGLAVTRFCGTSMDVGVPVVSNMPGPFVLQFTSDSITSVEERGFRFTYSLS